MTWMPAFLSSNLLTALIFFPLAGAMLLLFLPGQNLRRVRNTALLLALSEFALSLPLVFGFADAVAAMQFVRRVPWIPGYGIEYHGGVDGISLWLVMLTTFLMPIAVLSAYGSVEKHVKEFMIFLLVLEVGMVGVFLAFVAPAGQGRLVRAVRKDSVRFRDVVFMPDGKTLLGLSDETGEMEFVTIPANGVGPDRRLTSDGTILRFAGAPSPDGKWVAYTDNSSDLWVLEVGTAKQRKVSRSREGVGDLAWSPESRWLAYLEAAPNTFAQIWLYGLEQERPVAVTSDRVNSVSPAWDPKGEFLYFLSNRNLESLVGAPWGPRQPEPIFDRDMEVYAVALRAGVRLPFRPDDELARSAETADKTPEKAAGAAAASDAHKNGKADFDNQSSEKYSLKTLFGMRDYGRSKLANILFM